MNITRIVGLEKPYIEGLALYIPEDVVGSTMLCESRWWVVTNTRSVTVVNFTWPEEATWGTIGRASQWVFFKHGTEVEWNDITDKIEVAQHFRQLRSHHPGDVIPWGDDIETLVALERM